MTKLRLTTLLTSALLLNACGGSGTKPTAISNESKPTQQETSQAQKLINQAEIDAQFKLALRYATGQGVAPNSEKARRLWLEIAEQSPQSQYYLGMSYLKGYFETPVDSTQGFTWLEKAANNQHPLAEYELSQYYRAQTTPEGQTQYRHWLEIAATHHQYQAQYQLATLLQSDPSTQAQAKDWYEQAFVNAQEFANAGDKEANYVLAMLLIEGHGVQKDRAKGMFLMLRSAVLDQPDALAFLNSARLAKHKWEPKDLLDAADKAYRKGQKNTANAYLMKAARFGQINALVHTSNHLLTKSDIKARDVEIAMAMLTQAGIHGNRTAMKILSSLYNQGYQKLLKADLSKAYSWAMLLASLNDADARIYVQQFNNKPPMNKYQFQQTQKAAKRLVEQYQKNSRQMWESIKKY